MNRKTKILLGWITMITVVFGVTFFIEFSGLQNKWEWVVAFMALLVGVIFMSIFWYPIDYFRFRPKIQKKDK